MDLQTVASILLLAACGCHGLSVHILNVEPFHVIPGSSLVLQARIDHGPLEEVSMVTWEREPETGDSLARIVLASCSGRDPGCSGRRLNVNATLDQQEATLRLDKYSDRESGVYSLTATDQAGVKTTAYCIVREYEPVHHVSVSINVSHSSLVCGEAWGTDPHFSWLHERAAVTAALGSVSTDGRTLMVSKTPLCGHFTCMVSNELGYSSATYTAEPCETEAKGTTVVVVCLILLLLLGGGLAFLLWRRHKRYHRRGERLRETLDDNI